MLAIEATIDRILGFDPAGAHALSLYLHTDPAREAGRNVAAQIGDLARPLLAGTPNDAADRRARGHVPRESMPSIAQSIPPRTLSETREEP